MDLTESGSEVVVTRVAVTSHSGMLLLSLYVSRLGPLSGEDLLHIGSPGLVVLGLGLSLGPLPVGLLLPLACLSPSKDCELPGNTTMPYLLLGTYRCW